jgi:S-adenosylmethionine:tRNA ribosyltransferase-isomerase
MNLDDYDYFLPEANLALEPAVPRDSSKLFIYNTEKDKVIFDTFSNIDKYLQNNSFIILNNTKVLPARVTMKKESGGKVVVLLLVNEIIDNTLPIIVDRKINVGEKISFDNDNYLHVIGQKENIFEVKFDFGRQHLFSLLNKYGAMPIPPYLKKSTLSKDDLLKKYQTIFAKTDGSAAAPTASLHFTDFLFKKLGEKDIKRLFVTLHVGMGTFAPITDENIKLKKLHEEYYG